MFKKVRIIDTVEVPPDKLGDVNKDLVKVLLICLVDFWGPGIFPLESDRKNHAARDVPITPTAIHFSW